MSYITKYHKQKAVYWGTPVQDGFGGMSFADPVEINCWWEDKSKLFIDMEGNQVVSRAIVYVGQDLDLKGYLCLGELSDIDSSDEGDPAGIPEAYQIRSVGKLSNLRGTVFERKVWLSTYDF